MAKKKSAEVGSPIGYGPVPVGAYVSPPVPDNNPAGPSNLPNDALGGYDYADKKKICFADNLGKGESPNRGDCNVITANGVSSSKGQGKNAQYNWGDNTDGIWNKNSPWPGGNMTGQ